jgi:predicted transcriptional regulator with HTH domain
VSSLPGVSSKILQYLNKISEGSGRAKRMDFLRIAGNEANLNDWTEYLVRCNLIAEEISSDGKASYILTEFGKKMLEILKDYQFLGPLFGDLSRNRRRRE